MAPAIHTSAEAAETLAREIARSARLSSYYENYNPDYKVDKTNFADPENRKIRIINVGTGLFSINLAYYISINCQNFELTLVEKSYQLGGVWNHNQYPGIACDVPSHVYQFNWAPNPDWPRFLSSGKDIRGYLEKVSTTFDLRKYMQFNTQAVRAKWHDEGFWRVTLREQQAGGQSREYMQDAEILVNNTGTQHKYAWPSVEGLRNYKGKLMHTADWDSSFGPQAWENKTVCVIGSGASAVQVVPQMQPHVKRMVVFSRTPIWFAPGLAGDTFSPAYSEEERQRFKEDPSTMISHCKEIERRLNNLFPGFYNGTDAQEGIIKFLYGQMQKKIKDPKLLAGFSPKFRPGCRRITPGDPFIHAVQQPNAEVVFKSVLRLTEDGVVDEDGVERKCDVVICATGFNVDYIPEFEVTGRNGLGLAQVFAEKQDNYMGLAFPDFPNYYCGNGPYWTAANGSLIDPMNTASMYVVQVIQKLQVEYNIISIEPTHEAMEEWVEHAQTWVKGMVWSGNCQSWYKIQSGPHAGRTNAIWPGISLHFVRVMSKVRWEDYDIRRRRSGQTQTNRFQYLGYGLTKETHDETLDDTPHVGLKWIDPRWAKAVGLKLVKGIGSVEEHLAVNCDLSHGKGPTSNGQALEGNKLPLKDGAS